MASSCEPEESAFSLLPAPGGGLLRAVRFSLGVQSGAAPGAGGAVGGLLAARGTVDGVRPHLRRDAGAAPRAIAARTRGVTHNTSTQQLFGLSDGWRGFNSLISRILGFSGTEPSRIRRVAIAHPSRSHRVAIAHPSRIRRVSVAGPGGCKELASQRRRLRRRASPEGCGVGGTSPRGAMPQGDSLRLAPGPYGTGKLQGRGAGRWSTSWAYYSTNVRILQGGGGITWTDGLVVACALLEERVWLGLRRYPAHSALRRFGVQGDTLYPRRRLRPLHPAGERGRGRTPS